MADTSYLFSVASDFGGSVNLSKLETEIRTSEITVALRRIDQSGDEVDIIMAQSLNPTDEAVLTQVVAGHDGAPTGSSAIQVAIEGARINEGRLDVASFPPAASRVNIITHDFTDPRTWYTSAAKIEDQVLIPSQENNRTFRMNFDGITVPYGDMPYIIDVTHGRIWMEDFLTTMTGESYAPIVKVDGNLKNEITVENPGGDYIIDYTNGCVTFDEAPDPGAVVTATYYYAQTSEFYLTPTMGKLLELRSVEIQFSEDISIRDTMEFQTFGLFGALPASDQAALAASLGFTPNPGDSVPFGAAIRYKSMKDFINEANGSYPSIPPSKAPSELRGERDMQYGVITYPWDYQAVISLYSSAGMQVRIKLLNDQPYYGEFGTATFYCFSQEDPNL